MTRPTADAPFWIGRCELVTYITPSFGCHASGAHGYAQQVALHVLQTQWDAVEAVAAELLRYGRWRA